MNLVDYAVLGVIGISLLFGMYRGFVSTVLHTGGCLLSFLLSFFTYPALAARIRANAELVRTLNHYTDASSRIGDLEQAVAKVGSLTEEGIRNLVTRVNLPTPLDTLLRVNLTQKVYGTGAYGTVADYVSQTILNTAINILCFLVCFALIYTAAAIIINLTGRVFRFPLLKQLDWLAGGVFGFFRGALICYCLFAVVPLVETMLPVNLVTDLLHGSTFAPMFGNGSLILSIMNGRF